MSTSRSFFFYKFKKNYIALINILTENIKSTTNFLNNTIF